LTFDPRGDFVAGWKPDGQSTLFGSNANLNPQLYTISLTGVMPSALPLPRRYSDRFLPTARGSRTRDGRRQRLALLSRRIEGQIWLANLSDAESKKLPQGTTTTISHVGSDKIYFIQIDQRIQPLCV